MATYLLTWNPDRWVWTDLAAEAVAVQQGEQVAFRWSTGSTTRIVPGDRLYILKQGTGDRGIFGIGTATSGVSKGPHYDPIRATAGDRSLYVDGIWEVLLNPLEEEVLPVEVLEARVPGFHWAPLASGFSIQDEAASSISTLWQDHLQRIRRDRVLYPDEVTAPGRFAEGATHSVFVNLYERNPAARGGCIAHYGARCQVCDLDFGVRYGVIGAGFIHVHHLKQLSEVGEEYLVDPVLDLRPVCPNCHAMLHQQHPPLTIEELKRRLNR